MVDGEDDNDKDGLGWIGRGNWALRTDKEGEMPRWAGEIPIGIRVIGA